MSTPSRVPVRVLGSFVLLLLCSLLFFHHLAQRDLWSSHEARAAQDAQTILSDGNWGLPRLFDRKPELQKPPLYYWLVAGCAWLRGRPVDAWAVRLPAAVAGLLGVLLLYLLGIGQGRPLAGFLAAVILATSLHYTWLSRTGRIDMPLTLAVLGTLACFHVGRVRQARGAGAWWWFLPGYLATAVAVMLKGPVGLVLPAAVIGLWLLIEGELRQVWQPRRFLPLARGLGLWWGGPLVLVLVLPWFVWAEIHTRGALWRTFFWYHNVERAFTDAVGNHHHTWWQYGPLLASGLFPWSLLLPVGGWYLWRRGWREDGDACFGLVWLTAMILVLSCVHFKRADYLLPAYPGAALWLGCVGEAWWRACDRKRLPALMLTLIVLGCGSGWWYYVDRYLPGHEAEQEDRSFAAAIRRLAPPPHEVVIFFRTEEHALAFHVGRPIDTILEWENLDWWVARPVPTYVIMPPDIARDWPRHVTTGRLEEVLRNTDLAHGPHKHPLILFRTQAVPRPPSHRNVQACPSSLSCPPSRPRPSASSCPSATRLPLSKARCANGSRGSQPVARHMN